MGRFGRFNLRVGWVNLTQWTGAQARKLVRCIDIENLRQPNPRDGAGPER